MAIRDLQILLVEDDTHIRSILTTALAAAGAIVIPATRGKDAHRIASESKLDLVLLDLGLPDMDGVALIPLLQQACDAPIIVISARFQEQQKVAALDAGADDYLTKPFSMRELVARIRVLLRRVERATELAARTPPELVVGSLRIDQARRRVNNDGVDVHLTPTEFDLLVCLASKPATVLTREHLLAEVWGWQDATGTRTVDSHVKSLRSKLGSQRLRTVHGVGYALEATP